MTENGDNSNGNNDKGDDVTAASTESSSSAAEASAAVIGKMLPIRMISKVVRGYGRGSSDLGIPTANLDRDEFESLSPRLKEGVEDDAAAAGGHPSFDDLPSGIYWGFCRIGENSEQSAAETANDGQDPLGVVFTTAVSIGYNPTYGNEQKTVEPHLIAPSEDPRRHASSCGETVLQDFYDMPVRLSIVGYLRPQLPFAGSLEKLVAAIKNDIGQAERHGVDDVKGNGQGTAAKLEKEWVGSTSGVQ